jgi:hypothetical protein
MKRALITSAFVILNVLIFPAAPRAQKAEVRALTPEESFAEIKNTAVELVRSNSAAIKKPIFQYNEKEKLLEYYLGGVRVLSFELAADDPYLLLFEKQIQTEALRDLFNRTAREDEGYWAPALALSEQLVLDAIRDLQTAGDAASAKAKLESRSEHFETVLGFLHQSIRLLAQSKGYTAKKVPDRGLASDEFSVTVVKEPNGGSVRVLPWVKYVKCYKLRQCGDQWQWRELVSERENMIGEYYYQAEWGGGRRNEGKIEVRNNTTITFRPRE